MDFGENIVIYTLKKITSRGVILKKKNKNNNEIKLFRERNRRRCI